MTYSKCDSKLKYLNFIEAFFLHLALRIGGKYVIHTKLPAILNDPPLLAATSEKMFSFCAHEVSSTDKLRRLASVHVSVCVVLAYDAVTEAASVFITTKNPRANLTDRRYVAEGSLARTLPGYLETHVSPKPSYAQDLCPSYIIVSHLLKVRVYSLPISISPSKLRSPDRFYSGPFKTVVIRTCLLITQRPSSESWCTVISNTGKWTSTEPRHCIESATGCY
jgi:hypothetical protein